MPYLKYRPSSTPRWAFAISSAAVIGLAALDAGAHGGIPRAYEILFDPAGGDTVVLRSDVWGFYISKDGGDSFNWVCAESYGGRSLDSGERRSFAMLPGGDIFVANVFQGLRVARAGDVCHFEEIADFEPEVVQDVVLTDPDGSRLHVLTASGSEGGIRGFVWESTDRGLTWSQLGVQLPLQFSGSSVAFAPSDPDRVYVAGKTLGQTDDGTIQRSMDGGQTWQAVTVPVGEPNWVARIQAIDSSNPDVLYFWMDHNEGGGGDIQPDQLWISKDAGDSWEKVYQAVGDLPGFTFSPDASRVAIAGPEDGIWMADVVDLQADGGSALTQVFTGKVWGLEWTSEGLFAGNNDFTPGDEPKFTYGFSTDEGASFEPLLDICSTPVIDCPETTLTGRTCPLRFSEPGGYDEDYLSGPRCAPSGTGGASGSADGGPGRAGAGGAAAADGGSAASSGGPELPPPDLNPTNAGGGGCTISLRRDPLTAFGLGAFALSLLAARLRRRDVRG